MTATEVTAATAPKRPKPPTRRCGYCTNAQHAKCCGRCYCDCHESAACRCIYCGGALQTFVDDDTYSAPVVIVVSEWCADAVACSDRVLDRLLDTGDHERAAKLRSFLSLRAASTDVARAQRQEAAQAVPKTGVCEHCGQPTRGGRFVAGHDSILKSALMKAAKAGDLEAVAEMTLRGWSTKDLDDALIKDGMALVRQDGGAPDAWLRSRVASRIA